MRSGLLFVAAVALCVPAAHSASSRGPVLNLEDVSILPQEVGRFEVRAACAPGAQGGLPSACRALQAAAPTLLFRLRDQPTGLDDADREALRTSPTPMTAVLGAPITKAEALALLGGEICGRRIFETDATDQYGDVWALTPYMYQADGRWVHRWTVTPKFAGYAVSAANGRQQVSVIQTRAELERQRGSMWDFLDRYFSKSLF